LSLYRQIQILSSSAYVPDNFCNLTRGKNHAYVPDGAIPFFGGFCAYVPYARRSRQRIRSRRSVDKAGRNLRIPLRHIARESDAYVPDARKTLLRIPSRQASIISAVKWRIRSRHRGVNRTASIAHTYLTSSKC